MAVRFKTKQQRKIAHEVAAGIVSNIKSLIHPADPKHDHHVIQACANIAYQWAWRNSDRFPSDMKAAKAYVKSAGLEKLAKEALAKGGAHGS
jgi:hypothetical protein